MGVTVFRTPKELKRKLKKRLKGNESETVKLNKFEIEERLEAIRKIDEVKRRMKPCDRGQLDKWLREDRAK